MIENQIKKCDETAVATRRYAVPQIRTISFPDGFVGKTYQASVRADADVPVTFTADGMPDGMEIGSDGVLHGSPHNPGRYRIRVTVRTAVASKTREIPLWIHDRSENPPVITTTALPPAVRGRDYLAVVEGSAPATWSSPDLPRGLFIERRTGMIAGTPVSDGVHTIHITASNPWGEYTVTFPLTIT